MALSMPAACHNVKPSFHIILHSCFLCKKQDSTKISSKVITLLPLAPLRGNSPLLYGSINDKPPFLSVLPTTFAMQYDSDFIYNKCMHSLPVSAKFIVTHLSVSLGNKWSVEQQFNYTHNIAPSISKMHNEINPILHEDALQTF